MKRSEQPFINTKFKFSILIGIILGSVSYAIINFFTQNDCNDISFLFFFFDRGLFLFYMGLTIYFPILILLFWYEVMKENKNKVTSLDY